MGFDLVVVVLSILLLPFILIGFAIFWWVSSNDRHELEDAFAQYARAHQLELVPANGEWPNRTNATVVWSDPHATYRLTVLGREMDLRTRLEIAPRQTLLGHASIVPTSGATFRVSERPAGLIARLLTPPVKAALLAFTQGDEVSVTLRRGRIAILWPGGERSPARIDEARRLATLLSVAIDAAFNTQVRLSPSEAQV